MRIVLLAACLTIAGCGTTAQTNATITLATTTSTRDSGLLDVLLPMFKQQSGITVKVVAVGSGQALAMGRRGDADVLLTHAPAAEQQLVAEGYGVQRQLVMYNDFVLVGPPSNSAKVNRTEPIIEAFRRIADGESLFVSRGDDSGTHTKELGIWKQTGSQPQGAWYLEAGSGMSQALRLASEKGAYTLSDRGTFLTQRDQLDLAIISAGDALLRNQYAVIVISSQKHPHVHVQAAEQFARFLLSSKTQDTIDGFGVESLGEKLFFRQSPVPASPPSS